MNRELVIAKYDKPTDWISDINGDVKVTIYHKGDATPIKQGEIHIEPNMGRCVHAFFNHIYLNYDSLSDYTFFAQDYPFDHWGNLIEILNGSDEDIQNKATLNLNGYYGYHNNTLGTAWQMPQSNQLGDGRTLSCYSNGHPQDLNPNINVDKYWNILFEGQPPSVYEFMPGGHFAITKERIRNRSISFYKKIVDILLEDPNAPWMIERLECYIFSDKYKTKF